MFQLKPLLFIVVVFTVNSKLYDTTKFDRTRYHLGITPDDPRVLNRQAACPPDCPQDCKDVQDAGNILSGPYIVYATTDAMRPFVVLCDMDTSGGGWLVFQSRATGQEDFYRNWTDYTNGFGTLTSEFWLGNHDLNLLLAQKRYRLRVDIGDFNGSTPYAEYSYFTIGSALNKYEFGINAFAGGTAGDSLIYHNNMQFSTPDQENDVDVARNCARDNNNGSWWYNACAASNLNGLYTNSVNTTSVANIYWNSWRGSYALKSTEMKFRPM